MTTQRDRPGVRVCLDISAALGQGAGIGRYTRELALALEALPDGPDLTLFHNRKPLHALPSQLAGLPRYQVNLNNKLWRLFLLSGLPLPRAWGGDTRRYDLFHGTDALAPVLRQPRRPAVITIHDLTPLIYPQHHSSFNRIYQRRALPIMARRASAIICDSACTQQDVINLLRVQPEKHMLYLGVDHALFVPRDKAQAGQRVRQALHIEPDYVLAVGTLEPRKNLITLLHAYARAGKDFPPLVLVGKPGWGDQSAVQIATRLGLADRVTFTGYASSDLLPDLYAAARMFVYPSLYEGFGLPVLEAMACGTPVITSTTSSLPEVAGNAAILIDPQNEESLFETMSRLSKDPGLCLDLVTKGLNQAARFTWSRTAQDTLAVYQSISCK